MADIWEYGQDTPLNARTIAETIYPGIRITDQNRPANSPLGRKNPRSLHIGADNTIDVAPIPGLSFEDYVQGYRNAGYDILQAIDEVKNPSAHATGKHWHIALGGRGNTPQAPQEAPQEVPQAVPAPSSDDDWQYGEMPSVEGYRAAGEGFVTPNDPRTQEAVQIVDQMIKNGASFEDIQKADPNILRHFPNLDEIKAAIDYRNQNPGTNVNYQMPSNQLPEEIVVEGRQKAETIGQTVAASIADTYAGTAEGYNKFQDDLVQYGAKALDALGITDASEEDVKALRDALVDRDNEAFQNPEGWSRFVGNMIGEGIAMAPLEEARIFGAASRGADAGRVVDYGIQGAAAGALTSPDDPSQGAAIGALAGAGLGGAIDAGVSSLAGRGAREAVEQVVDAPAPKGPRITKRAQRAQDEVNRVTAGWKNKPDIEVVDKVENIKDKAVRDQVISDGGADDALGFVAPNGKVYIVAKNHKDPESISATVFHEALGHKGLADLFGQQLDNELTRLYSKNGTLKNEVDLWLDQNGHLYAEDANPLARGIEEVLAERSQNGALDPSLLQRIKQQIKVYARRLGLDLKVTDREVERILGMAHQRITKGGGNQTADGIRYMYGGIRAKNLPNDNDLEEMMGRKGRWFEGPDGEARFEFSDEDAQLTRFDEIPESPSIGEVTTARLGDVLDHPELYKHYPEAANIDVSRQPGFMDLGRGMQGSFTPSANRINITPYAQNPQSTMLHEIQHWIQEQEGFAKGGSPESALKSMTDDQLHEKKVTASRNASAAANEIDKKISFIEQLSELPQSEAWRQTLEDTRVASSAYRKAKERLGEDDPSVQRLKKEWLAEDDKHIEVRNEFAKMLFGVDKWHNISGNDFDDWIRLKSILDDQKSFKHQIGILDNEREKFANRANELLDTGDREALLDLLSKDNKIAYDAYRSLFGEVEARDVQRRAGLNQAEREEFARYEPLPNQPEGDGWEYADTEVDDDFIKPEDYIFANEVGGGSSENRYMRKSQQKESKPEAGNLNLDKYFASKEIKDVLSEMSKRVPKSKVQGEAEVRKLARDMKIDPKKMKSITPEYAFAARQEMIKSARSLKALSTRISNGENGDDMLEKFAQTMAAHVAIQEHVSNIATNAGRVLRQFRMTARAPQAASKGMRFSMKDAGILGNPKSLNELAEIIANTPEDQIAGTARKVMDPKWHDYVFSWTMNSMFSGPNTHLSNLKGNALALATDYLSHGVNPKLWKEMGPRLVGMVEGMSNAFRPVDVGDGRTAMPIVEAFRRGNALDQVSRIETDNIVFKGPAGTLIEWPKKALAAGDQFWRDAIKGSELRGLAVRTAYNEGERGTDLARRVQELLDDPSPQMLDEIKKKQGELTYLDEPSSLTRGLAQITHISPKDPLSTQLAKVGLKFFIPIIRTPDRILAWALRWSPAGVLSKDFKAGGLRRQQAIAKIALGSAFYGWAVNKATTGDLQLTGSTVGGSYSDSQEEMAQGIKPYSIKIGDEWYSYKGWDPLTIPLATVANIRDKVLANPELDAQDQMAEALLAFGESMASSTWLESLQSTLKSIDPREPDMQFFQMIGQMASRFIPYSAMMRQTQDYADDRVRDTKGNKSPTDLMVNQVKNTVPGLRQQLPVAMDVYGREAHKRLTGEELNDPVIQELTRLDDLMPGKPLVGALKREKGEEAQAFQDRAYYAGQYLVESMRATMQTPEWQAMSDGDKYKLVKRTVSQMRKLAKQQAAETVWEYGS